MAIWKKKAQTAENFEGSLEGSRGRQGKKKNKKTRVIIAIVVIALIVIRVVSCAVAPNAGAVVTTTKAERGDLQESISTSGIVAGEEVKVIFSPVSARVENVAVAAGDAVEAGTVLVSFDMEQVERTFRQAALQHTRSSASYRGMLADNADGQGKLAESDVNLKVLEQQISDYKAYLKDLQRKLSQSKRETSNQLSESDYNLRQELSGLQEQYAANSLSKAELESKTESINAQLSRNSYLQTIVNSSDYVVEMEQEIEDVQEHINACEEYKREMENQKASGESKIMDSYDKEQSAADNELAEISYAEAEKEYYAAKTGIRAEFDGIITQCSAVAGATVTDGMQLLTIESSEKVKVSFNASKYDIEKLQLGQKVDVTISGNVYEGEVSKINRMATTGNSSTPMVGVEVHLLNPDDKIILGMDAKLTVYTNKAQDALLIPVEAVNADRNGDFLYVVENGKVVKRTIICGISTDTYTEVLEGITEADEIILTSYTTLEEGMSVTVIPQ